MRKPYQGRNSETLKNSIMVKRNGKWTCLDKPSDKHASLYVKDLDRRLAHEGSAKK